ncbi:MAG: fibronectin type III domain-containing protein, partial [Eubacterium sp.]|nr:fibronectin type III domain-containing protein [Eubacterium sp.]
FTSAKTKEAKASAKTKTLTGLKAGKKYYVRVRAYSLDSMGNRIYGAYSMVKSIEAKA